MGIEALALLLAKALAPKLATTLVSAAVPREKVLRWVGRDPPRLALREALVEALTALRARHPKAVEAWFDDVFLGSKAVAAELAKTVPPGQPPDPADLAALYVTHLGPVRDREQAIREATPVAADFVNLFRDRLRLKAPFKPLFDSAAEDASADALEQLALTLAAVPDLLERLDRAPARLKQHIRPSKTVRESRTAHFVGRGWLLTEIDERLLDPELRSGYILIRGEPGIGKSALMAELVRTRDYVHHFNVATDGIRTPDQFLRNACAQLIQRYDLPHDELPPHAGQDPGLLDLLFHEAVAVAEAQGELPVVLVVDALDEAKEPSADDREEGVNRLLLPHALPDHVYVVATIRTGVDDVLSVARRAEPIELREDDPRNRQDVRTYVEEFLERRADLMPARLRQWETDAATFTERIEQRSEGNFMYLVHVLDGIASGTIAPGTFGGRLEDLPHGLTDYYVRHWRAMRDRDRDRFERVQRPIICTLATAPGAVLADRVAEWINGSGEFEPVTKREVEDVLEEWRQFLNRVPGDPPRWRIYHASFLNFLEREVGLQPFRRASVAATAGKIRWDA